LLIAPAMIHPQRATWTLISGYSSEAIVGRTVAACAHPLAAWQVLSSPWRLLVLLTYGSVSYLVVLGSLLALEIR
jgi:hypothetical protein